MLARILNDAVGLLAGLVLVALFVLLRDDEPRVLVPVSLFLFQLGNRFAVRSLEYRESSRREAETLAQLAELLTQYEVIREREQSRDARFPLVLELLDRLSDSTRSDLRSLVSRAKAEVHPIARLGAIKFQDVANNLGETPALDELRRFAVAAATRARKRS